MPTDRALRHSCSRYIRARGAGPPEAIGEAEFVTRRLTAMVAAALTELQGLTIDFWGGPQLHLQYVWPQAARPLYPRCTESNCAAGRGL